MDQMTLLEPTQQECRDMLEIMGKKWTIRRLGIILFQILYNVFSMYHKTTSRYISLVIFYFILFFLLLFYNPQPFLNSPTLSLKNEVHYSLCRWYPCRHLSSLCYWSMFLSNDNKFHHKFNWITQTKNFFFAFFFFFFLRLLLLGLILSG